MPFGISLGAKMVTFCVAMYMFSNGYAAQSSVQNIWYTVVSD